MVNPCFLPFIARCFPTLTAKDCFHPDSRKEHVSVNTHNTDILPKDSFGWKLVRQKTGKLLRMMRATRKLHEGKPKNSWCIAWKFHCVLLQNKKNKNKSRFIQKLVPYIWVVTKNLLSFIFVWHFHTKKAKRPCCCQTFARHHLSNSRTCSYSRWRTDSSGFFLFLPRILFWNHPPS